MYERSVCGACAERNEQEREAKRDRMRHESVCEAGRAREGGRRGGSKRERTMLDERQVVTWTMLAMMMFAAEDRPVDRLGGKGPTTIEWSGRGVSKGVEQASVRV